jgi:hypothetical protein
MGAVPRLENGWAYRSWGFDSLPFRLVPVWSSRQDARLLIVRRRFEPCRRSFPYAPVVEREMTPGPQPGSCGFESRRGCFPCLEDWVIDG